MRARRRFAPKTRSTSSTCRRSRRRRRRGCASAGSPRAGRSWSGSSAEKRGTILNTPLVTELAAAKFLADGRYAAQLERAIAFYRERHDVLLAAVERSAVRHRPNAPSSGGGHLWLSFGDLLDERDLYDEARPAGCLLPARRRR